MNSWLKMKNLSLFLRHQSACGSLPGSCSNWTLPNCQCTQTGLLAHFPANGRRHRGFECRSSCCSWMVRRGSCKRNFRVLLLSRQYGSALWLVPSRKIFLSASCSASHWQRLLWLTFAQGSAEETILFLTEVVKSVTWISIFVLQLLSLILLTLGL